MTACTCTILLLTLTTKLFVPAAMATYDSLHRQCRTLESLFDTKLTSYSRLASTITRNQDDLEAGGSSERWRDMEAEVDELLEKVRCIVLVSCAWL